MTRSPVARSGMASSFPGGRWGVLLAYVFNGFAITAWTVRLPSIQIDVGMSAAQTGLFLTMNAVGVLVMATFAGVAVARLGATATYAIATGFFAVAYGTIAAGLLSHNIPLLFAGGVAHGFAFALTNVPQSVLAAASENAVGRTILPQFHAGYSLGAMLGAGAGAVCAAAAVSVATQFAALVCASIVVRLAVLRLVTPLNREMRAERTRFAEAVGRAIPDPSRRRGRLLAVWRDPNTIFIGLIILAAGISEGTANNWGAVAIVDMFAATTAQGAFVVAVFLVAQTIVRVFGGPVIDRFGKLAVLRASGVLAIVGVVLFAVSPTLGIAAAGSALWGAGSALSVPIGISLAAGDRLHGAAKVAAVTTLSSLANIAGPPLIGFAIQQVGVRLPIGAVSLVMVVAVVVAGAAIRTSSTRAVASTAAPETFAEAVTLDGAQRRPIARRLSDKLWRAARRRASGG